MKSKNLHVGDAGTTGFSTLGQWLPALLWAAVLFVASAIPGDAYPRVDVPASDKLVHFALYGVLGACFARALSGIAVRRGARFQVAISVLLATMYGASDELHQVFVPKRSADWRDVVADALGGLVGAALYAWTAGRWNRRRERPS